MKWYWGWTLAALTITRSLDWNVFINALVWYFSMIWPSVLGRCTSIILNWSCSSRPVHQTRGASQPQQQQQQLQLPAEPQQQEPEEEILGSDDEEQEDPNDYCKGNLLDNVCCAPLNTASTVLCLMLPLAYKREVIIASMWENKEENISLQICFFCLCRWLPPRENRRLV